MPHKSSASARLLCTAVAVTLALGCSDSTAPISSRIPGTYELSTVLDSLTYSDYCSLAMSGMPPICHDTTVANTTGTLHGFITLVRFSHLAELALGDTVQGTPTDVVFQVPAGSVEEKFCGSCSPSAQSYYSTTATVGRNGLRFQARLQAGVLVVLDGTVGDGEITGRVDWHTYLGCCMVSYYSGTFVARRQP